MIPAIALMIAVYGVARLFNDCMNRYQGNKGATICTWVISIGAAALLVLLAIMVNMSGVEK